jgi:hypothetical protein
LVLNRDRVLSKDDLLQAIWGGRAVSHSTLTSHINAFRMAVGNGGELQVMIRTIPRRLNLARMMLSRSHAAARGCVFWLASSMLVWPSSTGRFSSIRIWTQRGVLGGLLTNFTDETDAAIERLARAMRLSPLDPALNHMQAGPALAHFLAGRFEEACKWVNNHCAKNQLGARLICRRSCACSSTSPRARPTSYRSPAGP